MFSNENQTIPTTNDLATFFHVSNPNIAILIIIIIILLYLLFLILICYILYKSNIFARCFPLFYSKRSTSPTSLNLKYTCGLLNYSIKYDSSNKVLNIFIQQGLDLVSPYSNQNPTTYIQTNLIQEDQGILKLVQDSFQTKTINSDPNPIWNETIVYNDWDQLKFSKSMLRFDLFEPNPDNFVLFHLAKLEIDFKDPLSREQFMDKTSTITSYFEPIGNWLLCSSLSTYYLGKLCIGLGFYPKTNQLILCIHEANDLHLNVLGKIYFNFELRKCLNLKILNKCQTTQKTFLTNLYFNEKFVFKLDELDLNELSVRDLDILCNLNVTKCWGLCRSIVGQVCLGNQSLTIQTNTLKQWNQMIKEPNKMHVIWYPIVSKSK